jgi:hypothetical protein
MIRKILHKGFSAVLNECLLGMIFWLSELFAEIDWPHHFLIVWSQKHYLIVVRVIFRQYTIVGILSNDAFIVWCLRSIHHHIDRLVHSIFILLLMVLLVLCVLVVFELCSLRPYKPVLFVANFGSNPRLKLFTDLSWLLTLIIGRYMFSRKIFPLNERSVLKNLRYQWTQLLSVIDRLSHLLSLLRIISL